MTKQLLDFLEIQHRHDKWLEFLANFPSIARSNNHFVKYQSFKIKYCRTNSQIIAYQKGKMTSIAYFHHFNIVFVMASFKKSAVD